MKGVLSRTQKESWEEGPLGRGSYLPSERTWGIPQGGHQWNKHTDLPRSPAQASHRWTSWKPGSKGALRWAPNRPTSQGREECEEEWEWVWRDKKGICAQHWPLLKEDTVKVVGRLAGDALHMNKTLIFPQYSPGKWGIRGLRSCRRSSATLPCHPGHLIQGDEQAPSPKKEVFPPRRQRHSWRWKWAIKTDCPTQQIMIVKGRQVAGGRWDQAIRVETDSWKDQRRGSVSKGSRETPPKRAPFTGADPHSPGGT